MIFLIFFVYHFSQHFRTDEMRKNWNLMKDVADHTSVSPMTRTNKLKDFVQRVAKTDILREWEVNIPSELIKSDGQVLYHEPSFPKDIYFGGDKTINVQRKKKQKK